MATISQERTSVKKCPNTLAVRVVEHLVSPKLYQCSYPNTVIQTVYPEVHPQPRPEVF